KEYQIVLDDERDVDLVAERLVAPRQSYRTAGREYCERGTRCVPQGFQVHTAPAATRTPPEDFMAIDVMTEPTSKKRSLPEFRNEPLTDFSKPENRAAMEKALEKVKREFGTEYPLVIGGKRITGLKTFDSLNPSHKNQTIGKFSKGNREHVEQAIDAAWKAFASWSKQPVDVRAGLLLKAA